MIKTILLENMIDTIKGPVVIVSDQQKALDFYTQTLGFEIKSNMWLGNARWIEVAPKFSQSAICLMAPNPDIMSEEEMRSAEKSIGIHTGIWFYSNNIHSTYRELKNKGVDITAPEKQEWGSMMCKIKDQDKNSFNLISSSATTTETTSI
jgi:lactoylglutathione lyase